MFDTETSLQYAVCAVRRAQRRYKRIATDRSGRIKSWYQLVRGSVGTLKPETPYGKVGVLRGDSEDVGRNGLDAVSC